VTNPLNNKQSLYNNEYNNINYNDIYVYID